MAGERKWNAAYALAELLSRRGLERPCEALVGTIGLEVGHAQPARASALLRPKH